MSRGPEGKIVKRIREAILKEYPQALVWKIYGSQYQEAGIPDLICCINGEFYGFEVKQPGKEPTPIQEHQMKRIRKAGGVSAKIDHPDEALDLIRTRESML